MYPLYKDLRDRLGEPLWHDANGVPRYAPFHPNLLGIYDNWAVLFCVRCQACRRDFSCAVGRDSIRLVTEKRIEFQEQNNPFQVLTQIVGWGDAPWHDDERQCAGTTMSSTVVGILEVWHREKCDWNRIEIEKSLAAFLCDEGEEE